MYNIQIMQAHTLTHSHTDLFLDADAEKIFCSKYRNIFENGFRWNLTLYPRHFSLIPFSSISLSLIESIKISELYPKLIRNELQLGYSELGLSQFL